MKNQIKFTPARPVHLSAKGLWEFTPSPLEKTEPKPVFYFHIPTYAQRDSLSQLLFSQNCIPVTVEHGRSVLLSELYEVYDLDPNNAPMRTVEREVEDPDHEGEFLIQTVDVPKLKGDPDEIAAFLEGYYQRADIYQEIIQEWGIQEKERLLDVIHGADKAEVTPIPPPPFTPRETARAKRLSMDMLDLSDHYRQLQSRYADYDAREDLMLFRLFCAGWDGMVAQPVFLRTGLMAESSVERLREETARLDPENPNQIYLELVSEIRSLMAVDKELEKNSASPLGNGSSQSGSRTRSAESDNGDGPWMGSNTELARPSESATTSATSSSSQSAPATRKPKPGRTAKH